eukprot:TRINITY_DN16611_c0_g1_i2.p1 TRINITY_DN16611_c0_g1~~TRINITY_DN16611_c0_g1_i2.p1  ORF type:complete len:339 (-),score=21.62 TRINITY_DN16611_c0_g1_i2:109-1098(-)
MALSRDQILLHKHLYDVVEHPYPPELRCCIYQCQQKQQRHRVEINILLDANLDREVVSIHTYTCRKHHNLARQKDAISLLNEISRPYNNSRHHAKRAKSATTAVSRLSSSHAGQEQDGRPRREGFPGPGGGGDGEKTSSPLHSAEASQPAIPPAPVLLGDISAFSNVTLSSPLSIANTYISSCSAEASKKENDTDSSDDNALPSPNSPISLSSPSSHSPISSFLPAPAPTVVTHASHSKLPALYGAAHSSPATLPTSYSQTPYTGHPSSASLYNPLPDTSQSYISLNMNTSMHHYAALSSDESPLMALAVECSSLQQILDITQLDKDEH